MLITNEIGYNTKKSEGDKDMKLKSLPRIAITILTLGVPLLMFCSCQSSEPEPEPAKPKLYSEPPPMTIDTNKTYTATIETEKGNLVLDLFAKDVPVTVNSLVFLAREGFYDNCTFHRVIPGFMAQGGDPTGTGMGGPGYIFDNEISEHGHVAGALSMANAGADTNGCQFFITYKARHELDGSYSVFGQLIEGTDVLESLTPRDPTKNPDYEGDKIITITIEES